jgi:hypothetical protein
MEVNFHSFLTSAKNVGGDVYYGPTRTTNAFRHSFGLHVRLRNEVEKYACLFLIVYLYAYNNLRTSVRILINFDGRIFIKFVAKLKSFLKSENSGVYFT